MPTDVPVVKEYNVRLILPSNVKLNLTCDDKTQLQRMTQQFLDNESQQQQHQTGKIRFEPMNPTNWGVFYSSWYDGKQPLGKITEYVTFETMSVREQASQTAKIAA
jgi:hypothetical protein